MTETRVHLDHQCASTRRSTLQIFMHAPLHHSLNSTSSGDRSTNRTSQIGRSVADILSAAKIGAVGARRRCHAPFKILAIRFMRSNSRTRHTRVLSPTTCDTLALMTCGSFGPTHLTDPILFRKKKFKI